MRGLGVIVGLVLAVLAPVTPSAAQTAPSKEPALFKADDLRHDRELGIVTASGNVEVSQGGRIVLADSVTYNQRTDTVTASGNVSLVEPQGDVIFADFLELSGDLKNGIIRNIRIRLAKNARIAATGGRRVGGSVTEMRKAVYSNCEPCKENPEQAPIWQVKAASVVHDGLRKEIEYSDAWFEFYGVPVAYVPYLSHPDPSVKRKSGLLIPSYGSDSELGTIIRVPYHIVISPTSDATLTPIYTGNEGFVASGEYRKRYVGGFFRGRGSVTHASTEDGSSGVRGHFNGGTNFDINDTLRGGVTARFASDDTYLRRYGWPSSDTLVSRAFAEGFRGDNYFAANAYYFQGQRVTDDQDATPIVFPQLDYNFVGKPNRLGARWSIDANLLTLTRWKGTDTRRVSLRTGWQLPHTSQFGELYTLFVKLQTDAYWVDEVADPNNDAGTLSGLTGRAFPQIGLDWRLPFVRSDDNTTVLIEPVAGVVAAPNDGNPDKIPNEDSIDFELDDTNIFDSNRFTGIDRVEGGQRVYYGLKGGIYGAKGGAATAFIGQSYRRRADSTFAVGSGLEDNFSDVIGRVAISPGEFINLVYRFRLANDSFTPRRNELAASGGSGPVSANINYLFVDKPTPESEFGEREELTASLSTKFTRRWSFRAETRRDLVENFTLSHRFGLTYEDDCLMFTTSFKRTFTEDRDVKPSDTILFRLALRTLGTVETAARR